MEPPLLEVKNLTTKLRLEGRDHSVVEKMSFSLHRGKTLALVGESGCGKSMTALSLMRILPSPPALPPEGEALFQGEDLLKLSQKRMRRIRGARIAMIFQDPTSALNPVFTVGAQLVEMANLHLGLYGEEAEARAAEALREVGIPSPEERLWDYPHQMSGGMRQRAMIAMALLCGPELLIADEPTTALDVTIQAQVLEVMRRLQEERGMAILLITHDMGVVAEMADDVIVMYASQAVEGGTVRQIYDRMSHPYTLGLFNSRPTLKEEGGRLKAIKGYVPELGKYPSGCRFHPRCPFVMEKCRKGEVPEFPGRGGEGHCNRCLLWDGSEESNERMENGAFRG